MEVVYLHLLHLRQPCKAHWTIPIKTSIRFAMMAFITAAILGRICCEVMILERAFLWPVFVISYKINLHFLLKRLGMLNHQYFFSVYQNASSSSLFWKTFLAFHWEFLKCFSNLICLLQQPWCNNFIENTIITLQHSDDLYLICLYNTNN